VSLVVLALGVIGAILIVIAEFSTIARVEVLTAGACDVSTVSDSCDSSGFEQHGGAFILLGVAALAMTWGASRGASRPAATALVAIGVVVLAFSLIRDVPQTNETGFVGRQFDQAEAKPGNGLYLEIVGAGLILLAGVVRLRRPGVGPNPPGG
jgi:hypothetical protein